MVERDIELERIRLNRKKELLKKQQEPVKRVIQVTDQTFNEEVINQSKDRIVMVDFWAVWCMPCRMLGPILEELVNDYDGRVILAKLNVDENPMASQVYGIRGIPAVKLFKNGQLIDEFVGLRPKEMIKGWIDKNL